jgi:WD40 repeat protein
LNLGDLLLFGFASGDSWLFRYDAGAEALMCIYEEKHHEHEEELKTLDCIPESGLFISGGQDGLVKIWNSAKELVREIKFPEPIESACFMSPDGEILVGHGGKISTIS